MIYKIIGKSPRQIDRLKQLSNEYVANSNMLNIVLCKRVIKSLSGRFYVDMGDCEAICSARKKLKKEEILVGDMVSIEIMENGDNVVTDVSVRKNSLIRPAIANVDQVVIVVAPRPEIDYLMIDKLIINCVRQNIDIILCLNKFDLTNEELYNSLVFQYKSVVKDIIKTSVTQNDLKSLMPLLKGKLTCFAGQSAVGKSSISNLILGDLRQSVGSLSEKIGRGKNTTTSTQILKIDFDSYIIDTPGFSLLNVHGIDINDLDLYYNEFVELSDKCKFHRCSHTTEPSCAVIAAVNCGKLSKLRYERYKQLYYELKNKKVQY